ncbi:MAG: tetratricopeptide repeat protein [bacterium]
MGEDSRQTSAMSLFRPWYLVVMLGLAAVLPYLPGINAPFIFDDMPNIVNNPAILSFEPGLFLTDAGAFSAKTGNWPYRPLTVTVNSLLTMSFGYTAAAWHVLQIVLHLFNTVLVLMIAARGFRLGRAAFLPAYIFAVAPLQTQAVLYASATGVVLSCFFALTAVLAMVYLADRKDAALAPLVVLCAAAAFISYEGSLALVLWLPLVLVGGDHRLRQRKLLAVMAVVFLVALLFMAARVWFSPGDFLSGHSEIRPAYSGLEQVITGLQLPWIMAALLLFPKALNFFHHPALPAGFVSASSIITVLATLFIFGLIVWLRRHRPFVTGMGWYLAALLPAALVSLNLPWAEHRSYLALPGLLAALGYAVAGIGGRGNSIRRYLQVGLLILIVGALAMNTALRARTWTSPVSLLKDAIEKSPGYYVPWHLLASRYLESDECEKSLRLESRALSLKPDFADGYNTIVQCYLEQDKQGKALKAAERAVKLEPDNPLYQRNLAVVLIQSGLHERARSTLKELIHSLPPYHPVRRMAERDLARIKN